MKNTTRPSFGVFFSSLLTIYDFYIFEFICSLQNQNPKLKHIFIITNISNNNNLFPK